ncbi:hypothetical protein ACLOJK_032020 [Asimina triloba]
MATSDNEGEGENYDGDEGEVEEYDGDEWEWEEEQTYNGNKQHEEGCSWSRSSPCPLGYLYTPPYELMYQGDFHQTKAHASLADRFLLVNVQATNEFSSYLLNRDVWSNVVVAETIKENFVFWQVSDRTVEGEKVKTYYKLLQLPAILVLNPITGEKMKSWSGAGVHPETLLHNLLEFMEKGPKEAMLGRSKREKTAAETEATEALEPKPSGAHEEEYSALALPEEPEMSEGRIVCCVGLRFPEGQRLCRNFVRTDPIQLLWSWCRSELMWRDESRPFQLIVAIPGAVRRLHYQSSLNLEEADLPNCLVSVVWT